MCQSMERAPVPTRVCSDSSPSAGFMEMSALKFGEFIYELGVVGEEIRYVEAGDFEKRGLRVSGS